MIPTILVLALTLIAPPQEDKIPANYVKKESQNFEVYYDPEAFPDSDVKSGLKFLEKNLKEECKNSRFCKKPEGKIPIIYNNEFGPKIGSTTLKGFVTTINDRQGLVLYKVGSDMSVEDVIRHEFCHILIDTPCHWADEAIATLSESKKKQKDRLKYAFMVQNKLPDRIILRDFITKYDLSSFDDFLKVMGENEFRSYYGISLSIASWFSQRAGSRDEFIQMMNELGEVDKMKSESWESFSPGLAEKFKNNRFFSWDLLTRLREDYFINVLVPKYFGKKYTMEELEKDWRAWTRRQVLPGLFFLMR